MGHAHFEPFGSGPDPDLRERSEFLHLGISHFNTRSNDLKVTTGRAFLNLPATRTAQRTRHPEPEPSDWRPVHGHPNRRPRLKGLKRVWPLGRFTASTGLPVTALRSQR